MQIHPDKVYIFKKEIAANEAPFEVYQSLAYEALSRLEMELPASGRIVLKPNGTVLFPAEKRIVTHPGFIAGMLDVLLERGVAPQRLLVADGNSGENLKEGHTWEKVGYRAALDQRGVELQMFNGVETRPVDVPGGVVFESFPIAREVVDSALFFNVPLAKCHNLGCTTLAIKNLMGILVSPERHFCRMQDVDKPFEEGIWRISESGLSHFEDRFYHKLCDLVAALRSLGMPRLCMIDGLIGRDGTAFNEGENFPLGWTAIGQNEVHVDAVGTYLMGLDPTATPYLKFAAARQLGSNRIEEIEVIDLATGAVLDGAALAALRVDKPLMPIAGFEGGYYKRYREDGSVVPWRLDDVNRQRAADGLDPVPFELAHE
jgi:uncharacterized protein (DUF362 family)